jgi:predicted tellurium resistance membrane protein TerC
MEWLADPQVWISLLTLLALEIVLGIDNVIFISILAGRLPANQQKNARNIGLGLALVTRIILLLSISWVIGLTAPLFTLPIPDPAHPELGNLAISGKDLILLSGGLFLIGKSTYEIHHKLEGEEEGHAGAKAASFSGVIIQILILDIVFSLDSVITAVGMVDRIEIMIAAVVIAVAVMLAGAGAISDFVNRHPTVKMLALAFLILIGFTLVVEGIHVHIPKGYIYTAMAFSVLVEFLNLRLSANKKKAKPVHLHAAPYEPAPVYETPSRSGGATTGSRLQRDDGAKPAPHRGRRSRNK